VTTDVNIASASSSAVITETPSVLARASSSCLDGLGAVAGCRPDVDADEKRTLTGDSGTGDVINSSRDIIVVDDVASAAAADDTDDVVGTCLAGDVDWTGALVGWTVTGDSRARTHTELLGRVDLDDSASPFATAERSDDERLRRRGRCDETGD